MKNVWKIALAAVAAVAVYKLLESTSSSRSFTRNQNKYQASRNMVSSVPALNTVC